jgi:sigma-B regulation protein RsbU (phosphoserine phosphatase)
MTEEAAAAFDAALLSDDAETLYDRAPCGYLSTTPDGLVVKANRTFLTLTGYAADELVGRRTFSELLTPGGRIYHETHYAPMLRLHGTAREIALDIVRADGSRLPVLVNAVLERDESGVPCVIRTAVFDATDRREYERELLRAKHRAEESELRATSLARTLQQTLIPPTPPRIPNLDVAAVYRPAGHGEEVGGVFYDVFQTGPDWVVAIGDVCGKGAEAAVVTALVRYSIRAAAARLRSPSAMLEEVNEVLLRHETDRFCTAAVLRLRRESEGWDCVLAVGGHPLPLLVPADARPVTCGAPGSLLGVLDDATFGDTRVELTRGDCLVLYTDGVTEGRRGDDELFGDERLTSSLESHGPGADGLAQGLLADVLDFQDGVARDDIAILALGVPLSA